MVVVVVARWILLLATVIIYIMTSSSSSSEKERGKKSLVSALSVSHLFGGGHPSAFFWGLFLFFLERGW